MKHKTKVLAAIDTSAAAGPVLATAIAIGKLYDASVEAVHIREGAEATARAAADHAGIPLRTFGGDPLATLVSVALEDDVVALVLGTRSVPFGKRPAGHIVVDVITTVRKPTVVVPPQARPAEQIDRILVPLEGTRDSAAALASVVERARPRNIEIVVLHVRDAATLPRFSEQPQHETEAWAEEFLARCGCSPGEVRLEVRVGTPADQVVRVAEDARCQLVALSWAQVLAPRRAAVVRHALEESTIPVLLIPT